MTAFNKLYASNSELDTKTDQINHKAERLVAAVQNGQIKKLTARAGDSNDLIEENTSISHLADIQKDLEAMIHQDEKIKQRLVPVMQCMQYEECLIINRIHRLIECWKMTSSTHRALTSTSKKSSSALINTLLLIN